MGTLKVVIDTNVVISGLLFGGTPEKLIPLWQKRAIRPVASKQIIDEYLRVLTYSRFKLDEAEINFLLYHEILPHFDIIDAPFQERVIAEDPAEEKFIHCAQTGQAAYIISGDQHLLALKTHNDIKILSPSEFLRAGFI
jgi:putative PIN family toxin of toxin-antitoxin system